MRERGVGREARECGVSGGGGEREREEREDIYDGRGGAGRECGAEEGRTSNCSTVH